MGICNRVDRLESLKQLKLGMNDISILESSDLRIDEIVAIVRKMDMKNSYDDHGFDQEIGCSISDYLLRNLHTALDEACFLDNEIRLLGALVKNYAGLSDLWVAKLEENGDFNKNYESFEDDFEDESERVLRVLKNNLPSSQYEMAEFDIHNWGVKIPMDGNAPKMDKKTGALVGMDDMGSMPGIPIFYVSEDEYSAMNAARMNSRVKLHRQFNWFLFD